MGQIIAVACEKTAHELDGFWLAVIEGDPPHPPHTHGFLPPSVSAIRRACPNRNPRFFAAQRFCHPPCMPSPNLPPSTDEKVANHSLSYSVRWFTSIGRDLRDSHYINYVEEDSGTTDWILYDHVLCAIATWSAQVHTPGQHPQDCEQLLAREHRRLVCLRDVWEGVDAALWTPQTEIPRQVLDHNPAQIHEVLC